MYITLLSSSFGWVKWTRKFTLWRVLPRRSRAVETSCCLQKHESTKWKWRVAVCSVASFVWARCRWLCDAVGKWILIPLKLSTACHFAFVESSRSCYLPMRGQALPRVSDTKLLFQKLRYQTGQVWNVMGCKTPVWRLIRLQKSIRRTMTSSPYGDNDQRRRQAQEHSSSSTNYELRTRHAKNS